MDSVAQNSEEFCSILAAPHVVETRAECRLRRGNCGGKTGLEFEALRMKIVVK